MSTHRTHIYAHTYSAAIKRFETTMDPEKARMERIRLREEEERMERKRRRKAMGAVSRVSV